MNVLITGASGGFGKILACECARRGFDVFLTDINEDALEQFARGMRRQFDVNVEAHACDLTCETCIMSLMRRAKEANITFDMLLNVAGIDVEGGFMQWSKEKLLGIVRLNIEATLNLTHAVLQRRAENKPFYIVFVSSLAAFYPMPLKATYSASKRFLLDFSYALDREMKDSGVSALAFCPAGMYTTEQDINGIEAQGCWGIATTNRMEIVARRTISKALRGCRLYIPGTLNRILNFFAGLVPRVLLAHILFLRWRYTQTKWLTPER